MTRLLTWLRSTMRGEVSTADVNARRLAGRAAFSLADEAAAAVGADRGTRLYRMCAWNAFALQTIAETMLDVDTAADPRTDGYVPRSTLAFVSACLDAVPAWMRQANVVRSDRSARVAGTLPARLPPWRHDEPTQPSELLGLRAAYEALQPRVESDLKATAASDSRAALQLHRTFSEMTSAFDYACSLASPSAGAVDRGEARWRLLDALEHAFVLGQLLAMPTLGEVVLVESDRAAELPLGDDASWLQIGPGWPVLDRDGVRIGLVRRICGDRGTGEFEGLDVGTTLSAPDLHVPATVIARIEAGVVALAVASADLT
jgi:hypothetical protein